MSRHRLSHFSTYGLASFCGMGMGTGMGTGMGMGGEERKGFGVCRSG